MTSEAEDRTQVTPEDAPEEVEDGAEDRNAESTEPKYSQADLDRIAGKTRDEERKKFERKREEAERKAREKALQDQEDWKKLAEERNEVLGQKDEELSTASTALEIANERNDLLEGLVGGFIKDKLELVDELTRPFLEEKPVEEQAQWLIENAEKLSGTATNGQRPSGSRPTGRPAPVPRAEQDKEAREQQRVARVSTI